MTSRAAGAEHLTNAAGNIGVTLDKNVRYLRREDRVWPRMLRCITNEHRAGWLDLRRDYCRTGRKRTVGKCDYELNTKLKIWDFIPWATEGIMCSWCLR